eukprot:15238-Heterococcus_DN1.PRE.1
MVAVAQQWQHYSDSSYSIVVIDSAWQVLVVQHCLEITVASHAQSDNRIDDCRLAAWPAVIVTSCELGSTHSATSGISRFADSSYIDALTQTTACSSNCTRHSANAVLQPTGSGSGAPSAAVEKTVWLGARAHHHAESCSRQRTIAIPEMAV